MRVNILSAIIFLSAITQSLPLSTRPSRRLNANTCEFYGYVDGHGGGIIYNEYTIEMAGWGNDGSPESCAVSVPGYIQTQCQTAVEGFSCEPVYEGPHDTRLRFSLDKAVRTQPDCVALALRLAAGVGGGQGMECLCLADCWSSEMD
ncbi:hypothetical protein GGR50DRAFT_672729 [Xylaria sp. CBS 124048]|nr:hypothetical protein GGR50DRAFT_672729 [Xylaria sp. CBS 124048]